MENHSIFNSGLLKTNMNETYFSKILGNDDLDIPDFNDASLLEKRQNLFSSKPTVLFLCTFALKDFMSFFINNKYFKKCPFFE